MNNKSKKIVFGITALLTFAALMGAAGKYRHCRGENDFCKKEMHSPAAKPLTTPSN